MRMTGLKTAQTTLKIPPSGLESFPTRHILEFQGLSLQAWGC